MHFKPVFYINGILLLVLSVAMGLPAIVDVIYGQDGWQAFIIAQMMTAFAGFALIFVNRQDSFRMTLKETFLMTGTAWIFMVAFAALPFVFAQTDMTYTRAFFEAMSGITTTGATVMTNLDTTPQGILFWRVMLHWMGGIGFLIIALAILPMLQISGMQIFKTQSFQIEKVMPSADKMAVAICLVYLSLTVVATVSYHFAGMSFFDALCHAMSSVSTGGFSNYDASIAHFNSAAIDITAIVFMISGALPFALYLRFLRGDRAALWGDSQVRSFFGILSAMTVLAAGYLAFLGPFSFADSFRNALFTMTALMTTTGFANGNYNLWGNFIVGIAFIATFLGSCSGSTAGGIKVFRLQILWLMLEQQLRKLTMPHGIFQVRYNNRIVEPPVQASVAGFFFVYIASWLVISLLLQLTGMDFVSAFTGAIAALSNVGPGLGNVIGPAGSFATLNPAALWILSAAMLLGRLEFLTLLVILMPRFWRR